MNKKWINSYGDVYNGKSIILGESIVYNPTTDQLKQAGYIEVIEPEKDPEVLTEDELAEQAVKEYEQRVEKLIRERYTISEELSIQRQRDTKPDEFNEYFAYCEECKAKAKGE